MRKHHLIRYRLSVSIHYLTRVVSNETSRGWDLAKIGYGRVSSADQDHSTQEVRLKAAGCSIFTQFFLLMVLIRNIVAVDFLEWQE